MAATRSRMNGTAWACGVVKMTLRLPALLGSFSSTTPASPAATALGHGLLLRGVQLRLHVRAKRARVADDEFAELQALRLVGLQGIIGM